jgi:hypothetical protein
VNKPTRYYSSKQEKAVAKTLHGNVVPNSGAIKFGAGDVVADNILIECKTCTSEKKSFSIKREWLDKNAEEAFSVGKQYSVLAFNFGPDTDNYYILSEGDFKKFVDAVTDTE